jgi:hypothetical protein
LQKVNANIQKKIHSLQNLQKNIDFITENKSVSASFFEENFRELEIQANSPFIQEKNFVELQNFDFDAFLQKQEGIEEDEGGLEEELK